MTSKTLKFGVDVDRWKTAQLRYRAYMGLDIRIETNEPFKVNRDLLDFLQAVKDPTILVPSFSVDFPAVSIPYLFQIFTSSHLFLVFH